LKTAAADTAIALILSVELLKGKTSSFKRPGGVVKKIVRLAVETGGVTAITAVLNLVLVRCVRPFLLSILPFVRCGDHFMTETTPSIWQREARSISECFRSVN
jgi:hypothetical protein